jgi:hypothetical protein
MGKQVVQTILLMGLFCLFPVEVAGSQDASPLRWIRPDESIRSTERISFRFDGYTDHWRRAEWDWYSERGLFGLSQPGVQSEVWAMEEEIGNQLLLEELWIEPGFVKLLAAHNAKRLESPSLEDFREALSESDVLISITDQDPIAQDLLKQLPEDFQFRRNRAFSLHSQDGTAFVLASHSERELDRLWSHIRQAMEIVSRYDLHRGIPGVQSNFLHITTTMRHNPFELIDLALRMGCDWSMVCGFNDWMIPGPVSEALGEIGFPFTFVSGQNVTGGVLYGMESYPDIQDNTVEECLAWAEKNGGYYFSQLSGSDNEAADRFDGYLIRDPSEYGRVDELDAPFLTQAGDIGSAIPPTMLLFLEKGVPLNQETLLEAVASKQAVAVFEKGTVAGPSHLRDGLRILLLERVFLEETLGHAVSIESNIVGHDLDLSLRNLTARRIEGDLQFQTTPGIVLAEDQLPTSVSLLAHETRTFRAPLTFGSEAGGRDNPIGIRFTASEFEERALAHVDLPRAVELHSMRLDVPGEIDYPVTVYNYTDQENVSLEIRVHKEDSETTAAVTRRELAIPPLENEKIHLPLSLEEGRYEVEAMALGGVAHGKLIVHPQENTATSREEDLDGDGIPEIILENDQTRATVLLIGGRVIEYIVKSKDENLLFKLWPKKPPLDGEVGGARSFYPYGGLEEFTGYPYIGGHIVFKYEILASSGSCARVKVWANIHGSRITKIYTLFADSPLLEARYEMDEMTPTLNVIGINPLFEIGPSTGPEDRYYFPEEELVETVPELERYYGRGVFAKEGWAAGYDTELDISLLIGYPVNDAIYLHLWNNHPNNTPTPYYYTELQPWLELKHGTTTYFTYYVYGNEGPWEPLVEAFRKLGLVSKRESSLPWSLR